MTAEDVSIRSENHSHVRPEPIEAPQPQAVRRRDLVRSRSLMHGYNVLCAETHALISYENWLTAVDAYELYRAAHDRRGKR